MMQYGIHNCTDCASNLIAGTPLSSYRICSTHVICIGSAREERVDASSMNIRLQSRRFTFNSIDEEDGDWKRRHIHRWKWTYDLLHVVSMDYACCDRTTFRYVSLS